MFTCSQCGVKLLADGDESFCLSVGREKGWYIEHVSTDVVCDVFVLCPECRRIEEMKHKPEDEKEDGKSRFEAWIRQIVQEELIRLQQRPR